MGLFLHQPISLISPPEKREQRNLNESTPFSRKIRYKTKKIKFQLGSTIASVERD